MRKWRHKEFKSSWNKFRRPRWGSRLLNPTNLTSEFSLEHYTTRSPLRGKEDGRGQQGQTVIRQTAADATEKTQGEGDGEKGLHFMWGIREGLAEKVTSEQRLEEWRSQDSLEKDGSTQREPSPWRPEHGWVLQATTSWTMWWQQREQRVQWQSQVGRLWNAMWGPCLLV